jgi:hypothetical protein
MPAWNPLRLVWPGISLTALFGSGGFSYRSTARMGVVGEPTHWVVFDPAEPGQKQA